MIINDLYRFNVVKMAEIVNIQRVNFFKLIELQKHFLWSLDQSNFTFSDSVS